MLYLVILFVTIIFVVKFPCQIYTQKLLLKQDNVDLQHNLLSVCFRACQGFDQTLLD